MNDNYLNWGRKISKAELGSLSAPAIVARCLFGEARGASLDEKQKIGCVVRNRVHWHLRQPNVGEAGWATVILRPYQFSWTMDSDPNLPKVLDPLNPTVSKEPPTVWEVCCNVAELIVGKKTDGGELQVSLDTTQGSDHYYDKSMDRNPPVWIDDIGMVSTIKTERFRFFRSARVKQWTKET